MKALKIKFELTKRQFYFYFRNAK